MTSGTRARWSGRADVENVFAGGGGMGELMRSMDWSQSPLGAASGWPASLRTIVTVMLNNRHPMAVWWGRECIHLYNDAYRPILGDKHPDAMGASGAAVWQESWNLIGPMARGVLDGGPATWNENFLFPVDRRGFLEETYFTFSYSPIPDDAGNVGGVLVTTKETTSEVLDDRQTHTLRDLASVSAVAHDAADALRNAARVLARNDADFPFALLYLTDADGKHARLVSAAGMEGHDGPATPSSISLEHPENAVWPLARSMQADGLMVVSDLADKVGRMPGGRWPEAPDNAVVLPLTRPGLAHPYGFLVSGVNPRRALDDRYLGFFRLAVDPIITGISNARVLEEERRRAEALAEIDRAKTVFFSNVSHEFRTPLTLMLGPVEDLLAGVHGQVYGTQRVQLSLVHRNAVRLQKLVNALLDFSRIESGRIEASYEPVDLAAMTRDIASAFRAAIERAGLRFTVDCPPLDEPIYVDRDMWEKIVLNLLSNAFKYTLKGRIDVSLRAEEGRATLRVSDTGSGIPANEMPHLFTRFHRVHGARARTHEGSGIGLAFVQELVRLHGGTVEVDSTPGEGSTFSVTLPAGASHLPAERVRAVADHAPPAGSGAVPFVEEALSWFPGSSETEPARVSSPSAGNTVRTGLPAFKPKSSGRILLADDNADMLDYIRRILEPYWTVETRRNGEQALVAARANPPDLVLTDVMMPGLDGFELLRELRHDKRTRNVPVVMLSARAGEEARIEGLRAGAEDYLTKPFSARELLARVNTQLELAKLRGAIEAERLKLQHVFSQAPVAIAVWRGPQHVYELANPWHLRVFKRRDVIGRPLREVFPDPELAGLWKIWDHVYATGETYSSNRYPVTFDRNGDGTPESCLFAFTLSALRDEKKAVTGVVSVAIEVDDPSSTS